MTFYETHPTHCGAQPRKSWIDLPALRLLIAGVYFVLGLCRSENVQTSNPQRDHPQSQRRHERRLSARDARRPVPAARDLSALRALMPGGLQGCRDLSRTQFLERCTRLSAMGRLQIYNFHYYRNEFRRVRAVQHLSTAVQPGLQALLETAAMIGARERTIPP